MTDRELKRNLGWGRGTCESCGDSTGDRGSSYFVADYCGVTLCIMCSSELREYQTGVLRCPGEPTKLPGDETIDVTLNLIAERNSELMLQPAGNRTQPAAPAAEWR